MATVLVVDDCTIFRAVVRSFLTSIGHQVREAVDGAQGLKAYKSEPTDIVLLDVFMPEKDGVEMLGDLLLHDPQARVIAVSGGGMRRNMDLLQQVLLLGAHTTLSKPMMLVELKSAIEAALVYNSALKVK